MSGQSNLQSRVIRNESAAQTDPRRVDDYNPIAGGIVTAVRKNAGNETVGYGVTVLDDSGNPTSITYDTLSSWPSAAEFEVGAAVRLRWLRRDGLPVIDISSGGSGATGPTLTVLTGMLPFVTRQ